jgi:type 1 fimbria pilin
MRFKNMTVLVALAVFALGAVGAASASATLPEFVPGEGAKFPITFQDATQQTAKGKFETINGNTWFCEGTQVKGDITGAKAVSVTIELTKCSKGTETFGTGENPTTIVMPGTGTLVYINKAEKKVGILDEVPKTEIFVPGQGGVILVKGKLIIPITPLNTSTTKFALPIHGSVGKQEYRTYENEKGEVIKGHLEYNFFGSGYKEADLGMGGENNVTAGSALTVKG